MPWSARRRRWWAASSAMPSARSCMIPSGIGCSRFTAPLDAMGARSDNLIAQARAHVATAGAAMAMLLIAAGGAWRQAASPPPSLGVQEPARQAELPQGGPPSPAPARAENPDLIGEIG